VRGKAIMTEPKATELNNERAANVTEMPIPRIRRKMSLNYKTMGGGTVKGGGIRLLPIVKRRLTD